MELSSEYIQSLKKISGLDVEKLQQSFLNDAKVGVRFNSKKFAGDINLDSAQDFLKSFEIDGKLSQVEWCKNGFCFDGKERLGKVLPHEMGAYYLQEPSAMAPVNFLDIKADDVVLDLCASPGGKSTQIAEKLQGGFLVANEIVPQRAKVLAENVARLGFDNVVITNHSPRELEDRFAGFFDKILVDAPCSGEGMFRKNNNAIFEWSQASVNACAVRQKEIVKSAYKMLKSGGTMVYSTCTFSLEEDEEVIKFLLDTFDDLEVLPVEHSKYGFCKGVDIDGTKRLCGTARLYPYLICGEGHFFAVLHKKGNLTKTITKQSKKLQANKNIVNTFLDFQKNYLKKQFENFVSIGEFLYANCPLDIDKLKVVSAGLLLGEAKKGVFLPSWHLAHNLDKNDFANVQEVSKQDAISYLQGNEINSQQNGWILLTFHNLPLCFGKGVLGKVKNHYPKNLRKKL